jgi:hypothetical protein
MQMRTRIPLEIDHRDELLALAASRGEKNVSRIVGEAVVFFLEEMKKPPPALPPMPGRWERVGARVDRTWEEAATLLAAGLRQLRTRVVRTA